MYGQEKRKKKPKGKVGEVKKERKIKNNEKEKKVKI